MIPVTCGPGQLTDVETAVALIREAHAPFYGFCFEGKDECVEAFLRAAVADPYAELFIQRALVARDGDEAVGIACISTAGARGGFGRRDAFLLRQALGDTAAAEVFRRLSEASRAFSPVEADSLYVARFAVVPTMRRGGVGVQLMAAVKRLAASKGLKAVQLDVAADNAVALSFYKAQGFVVVGEGPRPAATVLPVYLRVTAWLDDKD